MGVKPAGQMRTETLSSQESSFFIYGNGMRQQKMDVES